MKITRIFIALFCFGVLTTISASAQQKAGWITLKGQLEGFSNQVEVEDMSEFQYLLPPSSDRMIVPDANGNFSLKFKATAPNYYRLGRNALYLSPGDDLTVLIDKGDPRKASFEGKGAAANNYMKNTPFPKGGSFIEAGRQVKDSPAATIAAVEEKALQRTQQLASLTSVSAEFRRLENARIKADLINSLYVGESYSIGKLKLKNEEAKKFSEAYNKAILPKVKEYAKGFTDASLMKLVVYRDIAEEIVKEGGKPYDVQVIKDWYLASEMVGKMQKLGNKQQLASFKTKLSEITTPAYKNAADKMLRQLMAFGKGDTAVDFTAIDLAGNKVNLSSLKGKVIYVDLWATWCGPCMQEMPHFENLKAQYKDNPAVVFVSLSIDDSEDLWKKSVENRNADGCQWLINRSKLQAYNIVGIPRTLLIDKDFKIVDMDAPMPSEKEVTKAIDELLK
ncbi:TlpA family protein disulfide reductase [Solitalea lacus]|uniref:TlpA family protein disulfide reductase n=1 Tax=Solitalea lacus TaxID=2911172 RepID=UPI001EDB9D9E|nr:TlpA disulfide reductase family protein [Solitalea lacus]UKJ07005.1 TlpA family protein disulfide reductase [Solitalea lacus]